MMKDIYLGTIRCDSTVKSVGINFYNPSISFDTLTAEEIAYWRAFNNINPGVLTNEDLDNLILRENELTFSDDVSSDYIFEDDFSTPDKWECINPYAAAELGVSSSVTHEISDGTLKIGRISASANYGYIYSIKYAEYDGLPIIKTEFDCVPNTTSYQYGCLILTSFTDINNFTGFLLSGQTAPQGKIGIITRKDGTITADSTNRIQAYTDSEYSTKAAASTLYFAQGNTVKVTMEFDFENKWYSVAATDGVNALYFKTPVSEEPSTNLYLGAHSGNGVVSSYDNVKIYKNNTDSKPVYRYTEMSTLESGNTQFKYTVSQNGIRAKIGSLNNISNIKYGFVYIYRSATVEQMKTLATNSNYYLEESVSAAYAIPKNYEITVNYDSANPGKRVTVLPYIKYNNNLGEEVYEWADECASVSPAGFMKQMVKTGIIPAKANIQYPAFYNAYTAAISDGGNLKTKYSQVADFTALFTAIANSADQSAALTAMNNNGFTDADSTAYYTLLTDLFSAADNS